MNTLNVNLKADNLAQAEVTRASARAVCVKIETTDKCGMRLGYFGWTG